MPLSVVFNLAAGAVWGCAAVSRMLTCWQNCLLLVRVLLKCSSWVQIRDKPSIPCAASWSETVPQLAELMRELTDPAPSCHNYFLDLWKQGLLWSNLSPCLSPRVEFSTRGLCVSLVSIRFLLSTYFFLIHIVAQIQVLLPLSSIDLFIFFSLSYTHQVEKG